MLIRNRSQSESDRSPSAIDWLRGLRRYLACMLIGNFVWEILQLPLYTVWSAGKFPEITFAVLHCTGGDLLISLAALTVALITVGSRSWPAESFGPVMVATVSLGVAYTIFSEWLNIVVRASWAYSPLMPVVPFINTGLSPLLQWIVIPALALRWARSTQSGK